MAIDTATGGTSAARPGLPGVIIAATIGNGGRVRQREAGTLPYLGSWKAMQ